MIWNVYDYDINSREIKAYNVFRNHSFNEDVQKLLEEKLTYEEFSERLSRITRYHFWSRAEYEIVITSWLPYIDNEELDRLNAERELNKRLRYSVNLDIGDKVDFYDQLHLNWSQFADYVYSFTMFKGNKK